MAIDKAKHLKKSKDLTSLDNTGGDELKCIYWGTNAGYDICTIGKGCMPDGKTISEYCNGDGASYRGCPRFQDQNAIDNPDPAFWDKIEKKIIGEIHKVGDEIRINRALIEVNKVAIEHLRKDVDGLLKWRKETEEILDKNL